MRAKWNESRMIRGEKPIQTVEWTSERVSVSVHEMEKSDARWKENVWERRWDRVSGERPVLNGSRDTFELTSELKFEIFQLCDMIVCPLFVVNCFDVYIPFFQFNWNVHITLKINEMKQSNTVMESHSNGIDVRSVHNWPWFCVCVRLSQFRSNDIVKLKANGLLACSLGCPPKSIEFWIYLHNALKIVNSSVKKCAKLLFIVQYMNNVFCLFVCSCS